MALLFSPIGLNALAKVRLLLQGLGTQDVDVVEVNGGNSVGPDGSFNVSDGAGGWKLANQAEDAAGTSWLGTYTGGWTLQSANTATLSIGGAAPANQPSIVDLRPVTAFRAFISNAQVFVFSSVTATSLAVGRLLSWDGTRNVYSDPNTAVNSYQGVTAGPFNLAAATVNLRHVTLGVTAGVPLTINLPALAGVTTGARLTVKDVNGLAGGGAITIDASGAETIDGALTQVLNTNYAWITLQKQSGGWMIVGRG